MAETSVLIHYHLCLLMEGLPFWPWTNRGRRHVSATASMCFWGSRSQKVSTQNTKKIMIFHACRASLTSASDERHGDARRLDLSVMTLRASVATCPALACGLLVCAGPCVTGWHTFSASAWVFTHKHIFSLLGCNTPVHRMMHRVKGNLCFPLVSG